MLVQIDRLFFFAFFKKGKLTAFIIILAIYIFSKVLRKKWYLFVVGFEMINLR